MLGDNMVIKRVIVTILLIFLASCANKIENIENSKLDYTELLKKYKDVCALGQKDACVKAGVLYAKGHGVEQNYKKSLELYKKSCHLDSDEGCYLAGMTYALGKVNEDNPTKTFNYLMKACNLQHGESCNLVARILSR